MPVLRAKGEGGMKNATNATVGFWANLILFYVADSEMLKVFHTISAVVLLIVSLAERSTND